MKLKKLLFSVLTGFSLSFTATAQVPNYVPTNGLQAWYPFNGNATDESANTNNGTVNGATLTTDRFGKPNSAYSFDGVNDYIDIIHNGILTFNSQNSFTISTWVKINSKKTTHTIISHKFNHRNGFVFDINLGGKVRFELEGDIDGINATIISQDTLSHNKWHHLVAYYDGINREMGIFVNGELVDSVKNITTNLIGNFGVNTVNVRIGDRINNPDNTWLDGSVDDISIFNRVLTSEEILQLYNNVKINNCSIEAKIEIIGNKNYNDTVVLCNQSQLMLKAYNFNDSLGLYKFKWYKNNVVIQGANQNTYIMNHEGELEYYFVEISNDTCNQKSERINFISNDINKVSISVQNPQNYTLVGDTTVLVCSNGNVVLQLNNTQFIDTIMWTGTGLVGNHYNNQLSLNNVTGNKLYTANIGNGSCNKSLNFKVNEQIVATPQIQNIASLVFKNDNPINLSGTPTGGMFTGKGVTNGVFNPTQAGLGKASITYTITENKCSKSANIQTIVYDTTQTTCNDTILVSVDDTLVINFLITTVNPVKNTSVKVYPNPATTSINIEFEDFNQLDNYKVEFLNSVGQLIQTININNSLEVIDVSNLSKGIYFLQISNPSGNIKANKKIVIN